MSGAHHGGLLTRRALLLSLPAMAVARRLFALEQAVSLRVRGLNQVTLAVSDLERSLEFYQGLFGMPVQARRTGAVVLRIGDGPVFLALTEAGSSPPSIHHFGMAVEDFDVDRVVRVLGEHGVATASGGQGLSGGAMRVRVTSSGNTREVHLGDPDGLVIQLQDPSYCGGSGALGDVCADAEPAPGRGPLTSLGLSHFTINVTDPARTNAFYQQAFGFGIQAYQAATPALAVGPDDHFLMFIGAGAGGATVSSSVAAGGATASSTTGTGGAPTKGLLDVCTTAAQCTLGHCEPMTVGGKSRCTTACTASAQCPRGTRCLNYGNGKYCLGDDVGRSCSGPSSCNASCLSVQGGPSYCTAPCASGADCPNGYGCNNDPGQSVCIRAEGYCTSASECTQACDPNPPLLIGGCTALCATAADCPQRAVPLTPWTCFGGYCLRPTDVIGTLEGGYSPTEYHCNGGQVANLCNDGLNTSFTSSTPPTPPAINCQSPPEQSVAGAADDSCVNSCRYGGGCAYGFNCVALGDLVTERIGVCMPSGAGEPGSACANNTQCVFGYCANNKCSRDCTVDGICPGGLQCKNGGAPAVEGQVFKRCE